MDHEDIGKPTTTRRREARANGWDDPSRRFAALVYVGLAAVAFLATVGQILTSYEIKRQEGSGELIDMAGRQRMLSQTIAKLCLEIDRAAQQPETQAKLSRELAKTRRLWSDHHRFLIRELSGDTTDGDRPLAIAFASLEPSRRALEDASVAFLEAANLDSRNATAHLDAVARAERSYGLLMDRAVRAIDIDLHEQIADLHRTVKLVYLAVLLGLFSGGIFVVRPAARLLSLRLLEQRRRLAQVRRERRRAIAGERVKSAFLSKISHELRTPLNGISGVAHLIKQEAGQNPALLRQANLVETLNESMLARLDDIMLHARLEAGSLQLHVGDAELGEVIERALRPARVLANQKGLGLEWLGLDPATRLRVDDDVLRRAIGEPALNAARMANAGAIVITLSRSRCLERDALQIEVCDQGPGFGSTLACSMRAFQQGDDSLARSQQGLGLGLSLLRGCLDLAEGVIECGDRPGGGARVGILLPVDFLESEAPKEPVSLEGKRVLLVEDNVVNRRLTAHILEKAGIKVGLATNGFEAMACAAEIDWDLILMDLQMPGMDGIEAARRLRAGGLATPIVALTANSFDDERDQALAAGMNDFLTKPIAPAALLAGIQRNCSEPLSSPPSAAAVDASSGRRAPERASPADSPRPSPAR